MAEWVRHFRVNRLSVNAREAFAPRPRSFSLPICCRSNIGTSRTLRGRLATLEYVSYPGVMHETHALLMKEPLKRASWLFCVAGRKVLSVFHHPSCISSRAAFYYTWEGISFHPVLSPFVRFSPSTKHTHVHSFWLSFCFFSCCSTPEVSVVRSPVQPFYR